MSDPVNIARLHVRVQDVDVNVSAMYRAGTREPIVFLHGFGSTKEDYADITLRAGFDGHPFLAYDAPGCGDTHLLRPDRVSIPLLVDTAVAMADTIGFQKFHVVGHSMGGVTALQLADQCPQRVLSFTNIEGNLAPEDCFLSRQIDQYPDSDSEHFFAEFIERTRQAPAFASALYAASLRHKVRAEAIRGIFRSMVDLSDHGGLMEKFQRLPCPKMFMYGEQNDHLSYLAELGKYGVRLSRISESGHFPMYSNPVDMWHELRTFLDSLG